MPFTNTARRLTGAFGVAFAVLLVAAMVAEAGLPGSDSPGATVELFAIRHYHRLQAGVALSLLAGLAFVLFAGALASRLRRVDDATGDVWAPCFAVGAGAAVALELAAAAVQGTYQQLSHSGAVPQEVLELFRVSGGLVAAAGVALAAALAAIGLSGLLNGTIPVPLSWLAFIGSAVGVVGGGGAVTARTTFGVLALVTEAVVAVWALAVAVWLLARPEEPAPGAPAGAVPPGPGPTDPVPPRPVSPGAGPPG